MKWGSFTRRKRQESSVAVIEATYCAVIAERCFVAAIVCCAVGIGLVLAGAALGLMILMPAAAALFVAVVVLGRKVLLMLDKGERILAEDLCPK